MMFIKTLHNKDKPLKKVVTKQDVWYLGQNVAGKDVESGKTAV